MTQNELTYLLAIAEHKSLTGAARALYLSQPSLSECLAKVEAEMGCPIFLRERGGLVPTAFGSVYLETAIQIKNRYRRMLEELEAFREMKKGNLTFGIPLNLGTCLLPGILPRFQAMYPDISVQFKEANSTELYKLLLSGSIDFSIMHDDGAHESITCEYLADDPFYLVIPAGSARTYRFPPGRSLNRYDLKVLSAEPFLMIASGQKLRQVTDSILKQIGIDPPVRCTTKSMETAKRLAAAGMGVTFLPYSYLNLFSGTENLACYPLDSKIQAGWKLVISYPQDYALSFCAREFIRQLKTYLDSTGRF